jgi:hypothetical protein
MKYLICTIWLFLLICLHADQEVMISNLSIKLKGEEKYLAEGSGKKGLFATNKASEESQYFWKAFLNCFLWTDGNVLVVNDRIHVIPPPKAQSNPKIEIAINNGVITCLLGGKESNGQIISSSNTPMKPVESGQVRITHMHNEINFRVTGFVGTCVNDYDSESPQKSEKLVTILIGGALMRLDQGSLILWGRNVGKVHQTFDYNALTGKLSIDGVVQNIRK